MMGQILAIGFPSSVIIATALALALAGLLRYRLLDRTPHLLALFHAACCQFLATLGFALSLLLLVLTRCVTEAPLRSEGLLSWAAFVQVLLVLVACHHLRLPVDRARSRAGSLFEPERIVGKYRLRELHRLRSSRFSVNLRRSTT